MAINIHTVKVSESTENGERIQRVIEGSGNDPSNAAGNPTIWDYLEAEASNDYLPTVVTNAMVITVLAGDVNAA